MRWSEIDLSLVSVTFGVCDSLTCVINIFIKKELPQQIKQKLIDEALTDKTQRCVTVKVPNTPQALNSAIIHGQQEREGQKRYSRMSCSRKEEKRGDIECTCRHRHTELVLRCVSISSRARLTRSAAGRAFVWAPPPAAERWNRDKVCRFQGNNLFKPLELIKVS